MHSAGVDPGVWHLTTGRPYLVRAFGYGLRAPKVRVRGRDVAGRVEAVGKNVTQLQPGAEVFGTCEGSFAEYATARQDRVALKPSNVTFDQAATIAISGLTALQGLRDAGQVQSGQRVLIIGAAGGVGTFAVQLAKMFGAHVTGVCSTTKMDLVQTIGADDAIDYTREDFVDRSLRYDLILDTAGNRPLSHLRRALTAKGTLVIVGGEGGGGWRGGFDRSLWAVMLSPFVSQTLRGLVSKETSVDLRVLGEYVEAGELIPIIDRTYSLSAVPEAIQYVEERPCPWQSRHHPVNRCHARPAVLAVMCAGIRRHGERGYPRWSTATAYRSAWFPGQISHASTETSSTQGLGGDDTVSCEATVLRDALAG